ncbi:DUF1735 domain-containing protein [Sphingobacterium luzhongxinii]|uniref:DUF1735 domain-containing protein n=1 Tax=Sphingobacterium luzhongxinii TaxID=2654181 RepID=UPI0013DAEF8B|nr:DUF1735 domain-containing protein [Sphingobacterium sp. xlx-73]
MKKILMLSYVALASIFLSSCLKDDLVSNQTYGLINLNSKKIIGFESRSQTNAMTSEDKTVTIEVPIRLSAEDVAESDLVVNLSIAKDDSLRTAYNTLNKSNIVLFPTNFYTVDDYKITIPKGSKTAVVKIKLNPSKLDPAKVYGLGITINSIEQNGFVISGNYGSTVALFSVKNKYDGVYLLKGMHNRPGYQFPYETEVELRSIDSKSVYFYWPAVNSVGHPIATGPDNALSWYGAAIAPALTFDLTNNSVINAYNNAGAGSTVISLYTKAQGADAMSNLYDPSTKTIYVSWMYNNNNQRAFFDTLTYLRPRK